VGTSNLTVKHRKISTM